MSEYSEAANLLNNSITSSFLEETQEMLNNNCFEVIFIFKLISFKCLINHFL